MCDEELGKRAKLQREKRRESSYGPIDLSLASKPRGIAAKNEKAMFTDDEFNNIMKAVFSDYEP